MVLITATQLPVELKNKNSDYFWMENAVETYSQFHQCWVAKVIHSAK